MLICHFCHVCCVHPMRLMSTCVLIYVMPSFQWCQPCIFVSCVLSALSLLSRVLAVAVFLTDSVIFCCYVNLLLQVISCIILEMFTKDDLLYISCYIHPYPQLQLQHAVACSYHSPNLLNNVVVGLLTLGSVFAMCFSSDPCTL